MNPISNSNNNDNSNSRRILIQQQQQQQPLRPQTMQPIHSFPPNNNNINNSRLQQQRQLLQLHQAMFQLARQTQSTQQSSSVQSTSAQSTQPIHTVQPSSTAPTLSNQQYLQLQLQLRLARQRMTAPSHINNNNNNNNNNNQLSNAIQNAAAITNINNINNNISTNSTNNTNSNNNNSQNDQQQQPRIPPSLLSSRLLHLQQQQQQQRLQQIQQQQQQIQPQPPPPPVAPMNLRVVPPNIQPNWFAPQTQPFTQYQPPQPPPHLLLPPQPPPSRALPPLSIHTQPPTATTRIQPRRPNSSFSSTPPMHASHDQQQQNQPTTIQLPFPPELEPHQTTHSWTIRGFQDLTKLMYNDAFIYSDRFKSPRGINDTCYLNPPQQNWDPASLFDDINDDRDADDGNDGDNNDDSNITNKQNNNNNTQNEEDSDYVWRMKMYPNKYQNEISLFLEAIQTPFEKQNCIMRRNDIEFQFLVYQLLKDSSASSSSSSSNDNNNIDNCSSTSTTSFLTSPSSLILKDSSKEIPQLVYVSERFKWNFDLQGACVTYGAHSIGTFQDLFQEHVNNGVGNVGQKRIKIEEDVNIFIRVHIHTYTKPQLQDYYRDLNASNSFSNGDTDSNNNSSNNNNNNNFDFCFNNNNNIFTSDNNINNSFNDNNIFSGDVGQQQCSTSFERFFNNDSFFDVEFIFNEQDNYDVANNNIDFISDNPNPCPTSSSPSSPSLSSPYASNPSNIRTIKAHKILLSQRSEYFDSMFKSGYKESTLKRIPIRSTSYEVFYIIISYIYSLKLPDNNDIDHDDNSNNILLSYEILKEIYINADMMRLEHLAKLAAERLSHMVNYDTWDQLLKITWRLNIAPVSRLQLKRVILEYVHKNWSLLKATENMKNLIATSSVENIEELMETKMFGVSN